MLTNDGELTNVITAAKNQIQKVYRAKGERRSDRESDRTIATGIIDRRRRAYRSAPIFASCAESESNAWFEVILYEGTNQQIRRMFDEIGHSVLNLFGRGSDNLTVERLRSANGAT